MNLNLQWMVKLTLIVLLILPVTLGSRRRIPSETYDLYDLEERPSWWRRFLGWVFPCFKMSSVTGYDAPEAWQTRVEREHGQLNLQDRIKHMECIDVKHELLFQERLLEQKHHETSPEGGNSILYPRLYVDETYNVAFKIGKLYPKNKPYLSVFLTHCDDKEKPDTTQIRFIRRFYVNPSTLQVHDKEDENWQTQGASGPLMQAKTTGAWYFRWQVPGASLLSGEDFCFLFDMSNISPTKGVVDDLMDLKDVKSHSVSGLWSSSKRYHEVVASPPFPIDEAPDRLSAEWFERLFGGPDLEVFMGGRLFAFRFYNMLYTKADGRWNQRLFQENLEQRAESTSIWLQTMLRKMQSKLDGNSPSAERDTGFSAMEDRRMARSRALGLLFYPYGRETLKALGQGLIHVAHAYEKTLQSFGRINDKIATKLASKLKKLWDTYFGGFVSARKKVEKWTLELRKLLKGRRPTQELLKRYQEQFGDRLRMRVKDLGITVYSPYEIERKLKKHLLSMVEYEIKMVVWEIGNGILKRRTLRDRWFETITGSSTYSFAKYITFASTLKAMGTKFEAMAMYFQFESQECPQQPQAPA